MPSNLFQPPTAARPGAPLGNTNALKHGFYSRAFRTAEQTDIAAISDTASLENEIQLMRVFILRIAQQETDNLSFTESLALLTVLSRASLSLSSLLRTQRASTVKNFHTELQELFASGRLAYARADALIAKLQAATPTTHAPTSAAPIEETDHADCRPPIDCLTCPEIATCPQATPEIRDLILALFSQSAQPDSSQPTPPQSTPPLPPRPPTEIPPPWRCRCPLRCRCPM